MRSDDAGRLPAGAGDHPAGGRRAAGVRCSAGARRSASRWRRCRSALARRGRDRDAGAAHPALRCVYRARRLGAAARHGAARRRAVGRDAASTTAVVIGAIALFARADFRTPPGAPKRARRSCSGCCCSASGPRSTRSFLGGDLFTLYVALELLTFAAVPLVCLDGRAETLQAALRYLLFALRRARCSICSARRCSTAPTARSTSRCSPQQVAAEPAACRRSGADDGRACWPRPRCSRCICGCRPPMPARRPPPARCCRRWWSRDRSSCDPALVRRACRRA